MPEYNEALLAEMKRFLPQERLIKSVYFGGGTPSYFPTELLTNLLHFIKQHFFVAAATEITIEANPGTISANDLILLKEAGFNRLSLGLQAAHDELLKVIGRIHSWQDFLDIFEQAREIGFSNIGVDLIFGLPGQSIAEWQETLRSVVALKPEHISAYGLQLEPETKLAAMVAGGSLELPVEDEVVAMMQLTMDYLRDCDYEHYEISNYARPGFRSVHNVGYWSGRNYLGFGAGASSTFHQDRWVNMNNPSQYIQALKTGNSVVISREIIDGSTAITEAIMLGLRMRSGINLAQFKKTFRIDLLTKVATELERLMNQELLVIRDGNIWLTDKGVLVSNYVITSLLASL
jgi:oxygen-independent coproporphyrinogen III oxidase